jgi:hypothetical protein
MIGWPTLMLVSFRLLLRFRSPNFQVFKVRSEAVNVSVNKYFSGGLWWCCLFVLVWLVKFNDVFSSSIEFKDIFSGRIGCL